MIVCTSPSFSKHPTLQAKVRALSNECKLNTEGRRLAGEELYHFIGNAEVLIVGLEQVNQTLLAHCPNLKFIVRYGTGLDNIDLDACSARGIGIGWTGGVNRLSIAELTLSFMLGMCRNVFAASNLLRQGQWRKEGGCQLSGKTIGIVGMGYVGKEVVRLLNPFNCRILANDTLDQDTYYLKNNIESVDLDKLLIESDIVTLHVPLVEKTHDMISTKELAKMKSSGFLINTARGGIINEPALKQALLSNIIAGAALDVFSQEPPMDNELLALPNLFCTPHIGGNAKEAIEAMGMTAIEHVRSYLNND